MFTAQGSAATLLLQARCLQALTSRKEHAHRNMHCFNVFCVWFESDLRLRCAGAVVFYMNSVIRMHMFLEMHQQKNIAITPPFSMCYIILTQWPHIAYTVLILVSTCQSVLVLQHVCLLAFWKTAFYRCQGLMYAWRRTSIALQIWGSTKIVLFTRSFHLSKVPQHQANQLK